MLSMAGNAVGSSVSKNEVGEEDAGVENMFRILVFVLTALELDSLAVA